MTWSEQCNRRARQLRRRDVLNALGIVASGIATALCVLFILWCLFGMELPRW